MSDKPIIIAICGKSASGKDSLAQSLYEDFCKEKINANLIVQDCTRPPRVNEVNGKSYNFMTAIQFLDKACKRQYLEYAEFKGWYYGTPKSSVREGVVNIGVFNAQGIKKLASRQDDYFIIPIYLSLGVVKRLRRSWKREGKFHWEFIRRAFVDYKDFKDIPFCLAHKYPHSLKLDAGRDVLQNVASIKKNLWAELFLIKIGILVNSL